MPVKTNGSEKKSCCETHACCNGFAKKIMLTLLGILLVYIIVLVGTVIRNNLAKYDYIGQSDKMERTITIDAQGKVTAKPDVAVTTMGMTSEGKTVSEAQQKNTEVMNKMVEKLKALGISGDDLQTVYYNIYPKYDYKDGGSKLVGYEVSQSVKVKVRDLSKANQVLNLAGEVGANNVGGLEFTIDDNEVYLAQAREKAMEKVAEKARILTQMLGVRVTDVISYSEYEMDGKTGYRMYEEYGVGLGGGLDEVTAVESGSMDVVMNVSVTLGIE